MRFLHTGLLLVVTLVACKPPEVTGLPDADVRVSDARVTFTPTYVGYRDEREVTFSNFGGRIADVALNVEPPFFVEPSNFQLTRGADQRVRVTFAPTATGLATAAMQGVALEGEGLAIPECGAATACTTSHFDGQQCVEENRPNGTGCETNCIVGQCNAGTCVGSINGCATNDACLVPTCDEQTGCGSAPRMCPEPASPCQVATCDSATGCGFADALDGTLCGDDDCFATQVNVCITGQCVLRPRPVTAQCSNRWVPNTFPGRSAFAMAYDVTRSRIVTFGGQTFDDTWTHDGTRWEQRLPVTSPSTRSQHAMTWDPLRKRVLLFGGRVGSTTLDETWEWDGSTWLRRHPTTSPPASSVRRALAWDHARGRAVLFLGANGTWEWDGNDWEQRATSGGSPGEGFSMSWDGNANRVVLFGGLLPSTQRFNTLWEWDGTAWTERVTPTVAPSPRYGATMTWDQVRRKLVLFGGVDTVPLDDTWEWNGTSWLQRTPTMRPPTPLNGDMLFATARQRVVFIRGNDDSQWEWDGNDWTRVAKTQPPFRIDTALATDTVRRRVVLFGGNELNASAVLNDTWEWDGNVWWSRQPPTSPPPQSSHVMSFDALRARTVLFSNSLGETWEWDGTTWLQRTPAASPSVEFTGYADAMAFDPVRAHTLLVRRNEAWTWDGTTWTAQTTPTGSPYCRSLAWDAVQQRLLLMNGSLWSWTGTDWNEHPSLGGCCPNMVTDPVRRRIVCVSTGSFPQPLLTAEWNGSAWTQLHPTTSPPFSSHVVTAWDPVRERVMAMVDGTVWHFLP